jgi:hypothetical protein
MAILVEPILLLVSNSSLSSISMNDLAFVAIQGLRLCFFLTLPFLYFGLRSDTNNYPSSDPEQQSLLRRNLSSNTLCTESPTTDGQYSVSVEDDTAATSEDEWLAKRRKAKERILKRLKQDGNWLTYIKGFSVG